MRVVPPETATARSVSPTTQPVASASARPSSRSVTTSAMPSNTGLSWMPSESGMPVSTCVPSSRSVTEYVFASPDVSSVMR